MNAAPLRSLKGAALETGRLQNNPKNHINVLRWSMWPPRFDLWSLWNRDRPSPKKSTRAILRCFSPAVNNCTNRLRIDSKSPNREMLHRLSGPAQRRINRPKGLRNAARTTTGPMRDRLPLLSRLSR